MYSPRNLGITQIQVVSNEDQKGTWIHTPDECMEMEKADGGAHFICERTAPFIVKRDSAGSAPTAKI